MSSPLDEEMASEVGLPLKASERSLLLEALADCRLAPRAGRARSTDQLGFSARSPACLLVLAWRQGEVRDGLRPLSNPPNAASTGLNHLRSAFSNGRMKLRSYRSTQPLSSRMRSAATNSSSTPNRLRYLS